MEARCSSFPENIQPGSGAHLSYSVCTVGTFSGVKRPEREADYSSPYIAKVKSDWSCASPPYAFMSCAVNVTFLGALPSLCLSVRPHGNWQLLDGFPLNLIFEYFSKNSSSIKI